MIALAAGTCLTCSKPLDPERQRSGAMKYCDRWCYSQRPRQPRLPRVKDGIPMRALGYIRKHGYSSLKEIAEAIGEDSHAVRVSLHKYVAEGVIEQCYGFTRVGKERFKFMEGAKK